jgi:hypothetical protein
MQPRAVLRSARVQATLAAMEDERHQAVFRTIGRAYALLQADLPAGAALVRQAAAASPDPSFSSPVADSYRSRGQEFADRAVAAVVQKCKTLLQDRDKEGAEKLLQSVTRTLPFASSQARLEWDRALKKTSATSVFRRRG